MQQTPSVPITYREYKFSEDFPLLLMHGTQISSQVDFIHFHNCIEIAFLEKGTMTWNLENKTYQLHPGDICFLPPFFTHASFFPPQETEDVLCHYFFFNTEDLLAPLYPNGLPQDFFWYRYTDFSKILSGEAFIQEKLLLQTIVKEVSSQNEYCRPIVMGLIQNLMVLLYRQYRNNPVSTQRNNTLTLLFPAISYMNRDYQQNTDQKILAGLCGLSTSQFSEKFRECFHQTPRQYLYVIRIRKACQLLTSTEENILDIALQTGFTSLSSFNRHFLQVMGRSPLAFRNEKRAIPKKDWKYLPYQQTNRIP